MNDGKKIEAFDIRDHGADHQQYFQGAGVYGTKFTDCYLGAGSTPAEAFGDALTQIFDGGDFADGEIEKIEASEEGQAVANDHRSAIPLLDEGEGDADSPDGSPHPEWYHYVSIRVR